MMIIREAGGRGGMERAGIFPPTSLVEKDKELPQVFPYEKESRP